MKASTSGWTFSTVGVGLGPQDDILTAFVPDRNAGVRP